MAVVAAAISFLFPGFGQALPERFVRALVFFGAWWVASLLGADQFGAIPCSSGSSRPSTPSS